MHSPWLVTLLYLLAINILTVLIFAFDKRRARRRQWRISERTLLLVCFAGGTLAAYWARQKFRHKTRKQPFSTFLHVIAVVQLLIIIGAVWFVLTGKYL